MPEDLEAVAAAMTEYMSKGDLDALAERCAPGVEGVILSPTEGPIVLRGIDEVRGFWRRLHETWEGYTLTNETIAPGSHDRVAVSFRRRGRGRMSGAEVDEVRHQVITLRDGLVIRFENVASWDEALERAGAAPQLPDS